MSSNQYSVLGSSSRMQENAAPAGSGDQPGGRRRRNHRAGKKKRAARRKSFAVQPEDSQDDHMPSPARESFYHAHGRNVSTTSIDSQALLDHRDYQPVRPRRSSTMQLSSSNLQVPSFMPSRLRTLQPRDESGDDDNDPWNEGAPLLGTSMHQRGGDSPRLPYSAGNVADRPVRRGSRPGSSKSSRQRIQFGSVDAPYNVNYPPSVPGTPRQGPADRGLDMSFGDAMLRDELSLDDSRRPSEVADRQGLEDVLEGSPDQARRKTLLLPDDVCLPTAGMSDMADDELHTMEPFRRRPGRRRRKWPELDYLEEWSRLEKEVRTHEERRAKRITEPQLINGRLRAVHRNWYRSEEDAPYRFTYFNEVVQSTIHAQTISELVQPGGSFEELFRPDPMLLSDESDSEYEEMEPSPLSEVQRVSSPRPEQSQPSTRQASIQEYLPPTQGESAREGAISPTQTIPALSQVTTEAAGARTPTPGGMQSPPTGKVPTPPEQVANLPNGKKVKLPRYGERPVWWLDILCPTEDEMKMLAKVFGIHPLTAEDIMQHEDREKVELFRNYYLVNYRTFNQDIESEDYLEPVNFYIVVFREGVLSFHFSQTPHAANVRRRIRQLKDYMTFSADWISYAVIDDVTDVFGPLIHAIADEVEEIDETILRLHSSSRTTGGSNAEKTREKGKQGWDEKSVLSSDDGVVNSQSADDVMRRIGDVRKRVTGLYRLLGTKADVIKGFAKRCNEQWDVAPRSDIGLFLGDIQDHIVTMTANLSHYEKILRDSHATYLAHINIRMNERQEQTADVLGKLTVLGTIVLPMNIITGLWGMNVWVPGQEYEGDLTWFFCITGGLLVFGLACYWIAKRVYGIV